MKEKIKDAGYMLLGLAFFMGFILLAVVMFKGGIWVSARLHPILEIISAITLLVTVVVLLPLAIFKKTRAASITGLLLSSKIFGLSLWIWSFLLSYIFWGFIGAFLGVFLFGIGVIPVAIIGTIVNAEWRTLGDITLLIVLAGGTKLFAGHMWDKMLIEEILRKHKKSKTKK